MDFARKMMEKYGWTDGKGLGKHENGMTEALKLKMKRSTTGIGHDAAAEFNEHWWSALYDKAASNIQVKDEDGVTKKIKTKDNDTFVITNSTWKLKMKKKNSNENNDTEQYVDFFVKTAVLGSGGVKMERLRKESESEEEEVEPKGLAMTDEELFAACGGRTAHKGARHGLKALGKLARIEQQEKLLLQQSRFNGYNQEKHDKSLNDRQVVEDTNLNSDDGNVSRKKKKKKKHCTNHEISCGSDEIAKSEATVDTNTVENVENIEQTSNCDEDTSRRKKKKKKVQEFVKDDDDCDVFQDIIRMALETPAFPGKVKKKKTEAIHNDTVSENTDGNDKKIKKSKRRDKLDEADSEEVSKPKKKKKNSPN